MFWLKRSLPKKHEQPVNRCVFNGRLHLLGILCGSNLDVGARWDVGSSTGSRSGTAFGVFRRLQIANLHHPHHVFIWFLSRRKINNTKLSHLIPPFDH